MAELIRASPLAMLVSNGPPEQGPFATHLPVIPCPQPPGAAAGDLAGSVLLGHMNRANPHWKALAAGTPMMLAFTGPHGYVSPSVYGFTPAAPTWNFTAVHARGTLEKIEEDLPGDETLHVVTSTVRAFEERFGDGWDMAGSLGYFRKILPAVGAFRFTVSAADGMFKLSQEQAPGTQEKVRESFSSSPCSHYREAAALMARL